MDFVDRIGALFGGRRFEGVNVSTFFKLSNLERPVQQHLQRVYVTLAAALTISALGCFLDVQFHFGGILTAIAGFGCMLALAFQTTTHATLNKRYALLAGFAFCQGAALGPLVGVATAVDPALVLTAFLGTAAIFVSFTLASLLSARRSFLFLGGWLSSAVMCLMVMRLGSWMVGASTAVFNAELYGGLMIFSLYVLLDTQMIVEKAAAGYTDHIKAALDLLVDVLAIFVRVLVILLKNQAQREEKRRRDERKRR